MRAAAKEQIAEAKRLLDGLPPEMRQLAMRYVTEICDLAERLQLPPRATAVAMAVPIGTLAMVEVHGNVHDDKGIDAFCDFARTAVNVGVAVARIGSGWTPGGPS